MIRIGYQRIRIQYNGPITQHEYWTENKIGLIIESITHMIVDLLVLF